MTINEMIHEIPHMRYRLESAKHKETLDEIEEVLRHHKEQDDDLISRQAALDYLNETISAEKKHAYHSIDDAPKTRIDMCERVKIKVDALPSVNPQEPKTGHWVMPVQDDGMSDPIYYQVRCSECGFDLDPQTWHQELHQYDADKFCPNCGCRMVEPQESNDKCKNCEYYINPDYTRCKECGAERSDKE